jgi:uncharacterized repeat protein (TIGR03837 family)
MHALHSPSRSLRWSIFCRVVDNFGDIGVCLRLGRTLAVHHHQRVHLRVDDWNALRRLYPGAPSRPSPCTIDGVHVLPWSSNCDDVTDCDVVVEAFACELPAAVLATMAARSPAPAWINLEYLSAEAWVGGCHRMRSPHPRLPLVKHFFFPGFDAATGGLLREPDLFARRDEFRYGNGPADWIARRTGKASDEAALRVSLFAYEQPQLESLLRCWGGAERPVHVLVPEGRIVGALARHFGTPALHAGCRLHDRALCIDILPFLTQDDYDRLLWACDLNFVRGEDSFLRAQWAARPFVWHVYAQQDDAHLAKLDAFTKRLVEGLDAPTAAALRGFWQAWNGRGDVVEHWPAFDSALCALHAHGDHWARALATQPELAASLVEFFERGV